MLKCGQTDNKKYTFGVRKDQILEDQENNTKTCICSSCGKQCSASANFCPSCGGNIKTRRRRFLTRDGDTEVRLSHKCEKCRMDW